MIGADVATGDPRRFRQFVLLDLLIAVGGVVLLTTLILLPDDTYDYLWPFDVATALCVALLVWSLRLYARGSVDAAVVAVCASFWLQLIAAPLVFPSLFGAFAVLMVWPVLFAVPHVERSTLRLVTIATAVSALVALLLATRPAQTATRALPDWVVDVGFVGIGLGFVAVSLTGLYGYSGRLGEVLAGLREANAALQASERTLEAKVEARTVELRTSREETARARDEAVGLSQELTAVFDNLVEGLLVVDADGTISRLNPALEELLGRSSDALCGRPVADVLPELAPLAAATTSRALDVSLVEGRAGKAVASAVTDPGSLARRATVILLSDVTAEREVDRMKTEFISTVSHELRTPLTSILGFAKIIARRLDERILPAIPNPDPKLRRTIEQVTDNLDIIVSEGERLAALVNDVLDIAKMEAGRIDWREEDVEVGGVVRRAAAATASLFDVKQLPLHLDVADGLWVSGADPHRLEQVVINLLSNACKFTDHGTVRASARRDDSSVLVSVTDSGPGIAPEDHATMFERFRQVGDTLTSKPQGTGLGLPICREIVEHHGGRLWVESELGAGATFSFTLPVQDRAAAPARDDVQVLDARILARDLRRSITTPTVNGRPRILVVDDHPPLRALLREELEQEGYEVHEAADGVAAVRAAKELRPDLITLDVLMPGLDGFEVAAALRHDPVTMHIPIMMISIAEDEGRGRQIGVDRYLTKPVDASVLRTQVEALLAQGGARQRVLLLDTDADTTEMLRAAMEQLGWDVTTVSDPNEAVQVVRTDVPDVVIARSALSDSSGLVEVLRAERGAERVVLVLLQ